MEPENFSPDRKVGFSANDSLNKILRSHFIATGRCSGLWEFATYANQAMFDALAASHKGAQSGFVGTCADVDHQSKIRRSGLFNPGGGYLMPRSVDLLFCVVNPPD